MGVYRCKEGWIGITIVTPAQWKSFCDLMGMPDLGRHPQHVMGGERLARADALEARFVPRFLDRTPRNGSPPGSSCACRSPSCPT